MRHGVDQLAELFTKSRADPKALEQLEHELQYRQVPKAVALLADVRAAMHGTKDAEAPTEALPPQLARYPEIWNRTATLTSAVSSAVTAPVRAPVSTPTADSSHAQPRRSCAVSTMTVDDACKVLKTTLSATWESIEQTRRLLVQQSSPARTASMSAEMRGHAIAEAARVNVAYATLSRSRQRES